MCRAQGSCNPAHNPHSSPLHHIGLSATWPPANGISLAARSSSSSSSVVSALFSSGIQCIASSAEAPSERRKKLSKAQEMNKQHTCGKFDSGTWRSYTMNLAKGTRQPDECSQVWRMVLEGSWFDTFAIGRFHAAGHI